MQEGILSPADTDHLIHRRHRTTHLRRVMYDHVHCDCLARANGTTSERGVGMELGAGDERQLGHDRCALSHGSTQSR